MTIEHRELKNGVSLIVEEMDHVESVAYDILIPGGIISDAPGEIGASIILAELIGKGGGDFDSRQLSESFDGAGIKRFSDCRKAR